MSKVVVSLDQQSAVVTSDDQKTNVQALIAAATNAGYPARPVGQGGWASGRPMLNPKLVAQDFSGTEVRPCVMFPDWTAVRSAQASDALVAILGAFRADQCWRGYSASEDQVRSSIIRHYAAAGCAPSLSELRAGTRVPQDALRGLLRQLRDRDLVVLDEERIVGAYPLTSRNTEHQVHLGGKTVHAMCAVDALGVGAMLGRDIEIASACRQCPQAAGYPLSLDEALQVGRAIFGPTLAGLDTAV